MPRVKIDYIVSFSSEDPEHPANNLLLREVSKKKWLCKRGESSCSVVLQLPRTVKITGVHIGAYHAAFVQVLVGRSETSSEEFQVLVPNSVFITREESRRDAAVVRVRSFSGDALGAARAQRWDRVRVLCQQPHSKHAQFGLSFVHIDEAEGDAPAAVPPPMLALDTFSSDEDDFKPGELFAKHLQKTSEEVQSITSSNTGTQIRQATSQALKNINELSTKLMKTPISKPSVKRAPSPSSARSDRARDALLYTRDDTAPHARIDRVLSRHKQEAIKHEVSDKLNHANQNTKDVSKLKYESKTQDEPKRTPKRNQSESPPRPQRNNDMPTNGQTKDKEVRKRRRSNSQDQEQAGAQVSCRLSGGSEQAELAPGPVSASPHELLRGAVLVLSGYQHPRRAAVRAQALALGARVRPDWGPDCTHLICAFPNTPKLRAVRARGGALVPAARAEWLEHVARRRRLLPWRWFATEQKHLIRPRPDQLLDDDDAQPASRQASQEPDSDGDTDDEIEKVLQERKRRRVNESSTSGDTHKRDESPGAIASDEPRSGSSDTEDEGPTDEEAPGPPAPGPARAALPHFFAGCTFAMDAAPGPARELARYVRAYGGLALQMSEVGEGSEVDYVVRGRSAAGDARSEAVACGARIVSAAWLARCHEAKARVPH